MKTTTEMRPVPIEKETAKFPENDTKSTMLVY
jgi:hypothetical protein